MQNDNELSKWLAPHTDKNLQEMKEQANSPSLAAKQAYINALEKHLKVAELNSNQLLDAVELARKFHAAYEKLALQFGYTTRQDTREFNPASQNGQLMIATIQEVFSGIK